MLTGTVTTTVTGEDTALAEAILANPLQRNCNVAAMLLQPAGLDAAQDQSGRGIIVDAGGKSAAGAGFTLLSSTAIMCQDTPDAYPMPM